MNNDYLKHFIKSYSNLHLPGEKHNVFLFSTPRSGSTWLMELIWSQPGFKYCNEPLNIRNPWVRKYLKIESFEEVYAKGHNTKLQDYFEGIISGKIRFFNPNPFRSYYRFMTNRLVFKILHGGEDRVNWFRDTFNGKIVLLLRHPIPVSLSRKQLPRLDTFINSDFSDHFSAEQLKYSRKVKSEGGHLEKAVLSWCLQNAVALRQRKDDWVVVTYEQLTLDPDSVFQALKTKIALEESHRMQKRQTTPSAVKGMSDEETLEFLKKREADRSWLVEKWRKKVTSEQEKRVMSMLEVFDLDIYQAGSTQPADHYWINSSYELENKKEGLDKQEQGR